MEFHTSQSFLWAPLTMYGCRPVTLVAMLLTVIGCIGSAVSLTFKILLVTRAINGFRFGGMMSAGTTVVNDMFFLHERGEKTTMAWTYINVLPAVTLAEIYSKYYHMKGEAIGLSLGLSLIIVGVLGEMPPRDRRLCLLGTLI